MRGARNYLLGVVFLLFGCRHSPLWWCQSRHQGTRATTFLLKFPRRFDISGETTKRPPQTPLITDPPPLGKYHITHHTPRLLSGDRTKPNVCSAASNRVVVASKKPRRSILSLSLRLLVERPTNEGLPSIWSWNSSYRTPALQRWPQKAEHQPAAPHYEAQVELQSIVLTVAAPAFRIQAASSPPRRRRRSFSLSATATTTTGCTAIAAYHAEDTDGTSR